MIGSREAAKAQKLKAKIGNLRDAIADIRKNKIDVECDHNRVRWLCERGFASGFSCGAYTLRYQGIGASCTDMSGVGRSWVRAAERWLIAQGVRI